MFKKTAVFAAAVMALTMVATGCGAGAKSSIAMDMADEKKAAIEFSNAKEDDFVQGGYIRVDEGEGVEVKSSLNDDGKILIGFIAVEEDQSIDKLPDRDNTKYEMMISGNATQGATLDPGDYDLHNQTHLMMMKKHLVPRIPSNGAKLNLEKSIFVTSPSSFLVNLYFSR